MFIVAHPITAGITAEEQGRLRRSTGRAATSVRGATCVELFADAFRGEERRTQFDSSRICVGNMCDWVLYE
jgi:hypothetical protein